MTPIRIGSTSTTPSEYTSDDQANSGALWSFMPGARVVSTEVATLTPTPISPAAARASDAM